jgi:hypothetical protein
VRQATGSVNDVEEGRELTVAGHDELHDRIPA